MILTKELFEKHTYKHGITHKQCKALGITTTLNKGWYRKIIGSEFTDQQWELFCAGKSKNAKFQYAEMDEAIAQFVESEHDTTF